MAYAWLDGRLVGADEARVSIFDRGFLHGDGAFETIRIHGGAPFRFDAYLRRLKESLGTLGLRAPLSDVEFRRIVRSVVEAGGLREGLVRITVTSGDTEATSGAFVTVTSRPLPSVPRRLVLTVAKTVRRAPGPLSRCKTISRAAESAALREAVRAGAFDAILLNPEGHVVETSARNVFAVLSAKLVTPSLEEGALPGVTRAAVLELAPGLGLQAFEGPLSLDELLAAPEAFLTGSGIGVLPVSEIDGHRFRPMRESIQRKVQRAYEKLLENESKW